MGNFNCKYCRNSTNEEELNFGPIEQISSKKLSITLIDTKKKFESDLLQYCDIIKEDDFNSILTNHNPNIQNLINTFKTEDTKEISNNGKNNNLNDNDNSNIINFSEPPMKFKNDGTIYNGNWNTAFKKDGYGTILLPDGSIYQGNWSNDIINKEGVFIDKNGNYYKGELKEGIAEGEGELYIKDKYRYKGRFENDIQNGYGIEEDLINNIKYEGNFKEGLKDGKGKLIFEDGTIYEGNFNKSKSKCSKFNKYIQN